MENYSCCPSMGKSVSRKPTGDDHCSVEESGWTDYFQDFSDNNSNYNINIGDGNDINEDDNIIEESFCTSSSLVSDAASYAAWKSSQQRKSPQYEIPSKLSLIKKTRAKVISPDDSLEDTASSPVNSPKVGDLKPVDVKAKQTDDLIDDSMGKRGKSEYYSELQAEDRSVMDLNGKDDCLDLKKRGLCLVPLSILVSYQLG